MDIQELRLAIDDIDNEILSMILKRRELILEVTEYKKQHNVPIFTPEREQQVLERVGETVGNDVLNDGIKLLYGILMDINKFHEYRHVPKNLSVPTDVGGASVRAIIQDKPGALCRYLSPLAVAHVSIANISSQAMPGGNLLVDLELLGRTDDPSFIAALAVLEDSAQKFTLL